MCEQTQLNADTDCSMLLQTYFLYEVTKKRNLTCLSESTWIFTSCFCMFVLCERETALNFCGTSWVWVSIFVFHNLLSVRWTDACLRSPQPHDAKTNTQHNDCFMLHFTPSFFFSPHLSTSPFSCLCLSPSSASFSSSLSLLTPSRRSLMLNCQLFPELSTQPQLPFFFFFFFF